MAVALDAHPQLAWLSWFVKVGVIAGMTSVILTSLLGQPRILLSMADDGLLPPAMSRCHPRFKTPHVSTVITGVVAALIAAVFPAGYTRGSHLHRHPAGVCGGVPRRAGAAQDAPGCLPAVSRAVGAIHLRAGRRVCLGMTLSLSDAHLDAAGVWTAIGMSIYAFYGFRHSRLRK